MPLPRWLASFNKHTFNKLEVRRGARPVLIHRGRTSGQTYRTPLDAHAVDGGYVFIMNYGRESDWVKNIIAAGTATLRIGDTDIPLDEPRLISKGDAEGLLPGTKMPPAWVGVDECLHMTVTGPSTD